LRLARFHDGRSGAAAAADDTIVFVPRSPQRFDGSRRRVDQRRLRFWKDYINAHGGIKVGGKTYKVTSSTRR